jgi:DNA adenine methylase
LARELDATLFHPDVLAEAQAYCAAVEQVSEKIGLPKSDMMHSYKWAYWYFITAWMSRSGSAGTSNEFSGSYPVRWSATGGGSCKRFRSATEHLREFREKVGRRAVFTCMDAFDFIRKVKNEKRHGLYLDPPFPGPGDAYAHTFGEDKQRELAVLLGSFGATKVVVRYYDHELIRELYPIGHWHWHEFEGRAQTNDGRPEVYLTNF